MHQRFSCQKDVYESCKIYGPDGKHLCNCNSKKAMWYVHKGLGELIPQEDTDQSANIKVKLNFLPNSNKQSLPPSHDLYDEEFHIYDRKNCCVVCSSTENFARFNIVPVSYRSHFPHSNKSHSSHDIMLLCFPCQELAHIYQHKLKKQIETAFDSPLAQVSEK